jgi:hypothetical protein
MIFSRNFQAYFLRIYLAIYIYFWYRLSMIITNWKWIWWNICPLEKTWTLNKLKWLHCWSFLFWIFNIAYIISILYFLCMHVTLYEFHHSLCMAQKWFKSFVMLITKCVKVLEFIMLHIEKLKVTQWGL